MRHIGFGVVALCLAGSANAAVQLDQQFVTVVQPGNAPVVSRVGEVPPPPSRPNDPATTQFVVQTFTAGLTGILDSLLFQAASFGAAQNNGLFVMSLIDGDYLAGARTVVFENAAPFQAAPPVATATGGITGLTFDVSTAAYQVTAGQRYSVVFAGIPFTPRQHGGLIIGQGSAPGPNPPVFTGPGYQGGRFQGYINGTAVSSVGDFDVGFRSFVNVTAVPEPGTWAMMILGFGAVGGAMRRRSASAKASRTKLTFA